MMKNKTVRRGVLAAVAGVALAGGGLMMPVAAHADSSGPPDSFFATLPTNVNTNVPVGGSFSASGCSIYLSPTVLHAMTPGEVYWGRCDSGMYVATFSAAPATTWFAPAPRVQAPTTVAVHTSAWRASIMLERHLDVM